MKLEIYGRQGCPWCVKAKELGQELVERGFINDFTYTDYVEENVQIADIEKKAGTTIRTVPVVFLGEQFIGGYSDLSNRFPGL